MAGQCNATFDHLARTLGGFTCPETATTEKKPVSTLIRNDAAKVLADPQTYTDEAGLHHALSHLRAFDALNIAAGGSDWSTDGPAPSRCRTCATVVRRKDF